MTDTLAALKAEWEARDRIAWFTAEKIVEGLLAVAEGLERERDALFNSQPLGLNLLAERAEHSAKLEATEQHVIILRAERDALRAANGRLREALQFAQVEIVKHWSGNLEALGRGDFDHTYTGKAFQAARAALAQDDAPQGGVE